MKRWMPLFVMWLAIPASHAWLGRTTLLTRPTEEVRSVSTRLGYRHQSADDEHLTTTFPVTTKPPKLGAIDLHTVQTLCLSQGLVLGGSSIVSRLVAGVDLQHLQWASLYLSTDVSLSALLLGLAATVPMIWFSQFIDQSSHRDASLVQFATTNLVVTLFGRRTSSSDSSSASSTSQWWHVLVVTTLLTTITAVVEEVVFRGMVPTALEMWTHQDASIAFLGQAVLFGILHTNAKAEFGENRILFALQTLNASWLGLLVLVSGGNLVPAMVAHMLYDAHVLTQCWHAVNTQMDWTEQNLRHELPPVQQTQLQRIRQQAPGLTDELVDFSRRFFYAFDRQHVGSLSLEDTQRAVSYAFLANDVVPSQDDVQILFEGLHDEQGERISLPNFLQLLFRLRAQLYSSR